MRRKLDWEEVHLHQALEAANQSPLLPIPGGFMVLQTVDVTDDGEAEYECYRFIGGGAEMCQARMSDFHDGE